MSEPAGSLTLAARRAGSRTIVERIRYDGISRCSRAFAQGDAALVVLSQLGPGVIRGDAVTARGVVGPGAHLIVTQQTATRLLGGRHESQSCATWSVGDGATLELIAEPLVAHADARYDAWTAIELGRDSRLLISELAQIPAGARVRLRTSVRRAGREVLYDAVDAATAAPHVVGTLAILGICGDHLVALTQVLDAAADGTALRVGVGVLPEGVFIRVLGTDPWAVRLLLAAFRAAARLASRR